MNKEINGAYLFAPMEKECGAHHSGIYKKVRNQTVALSKFYKTGLVVLSENESGVFHKILCRLPFFSVSNYDWTYHGDFDELDFLYIRQVKLDFPFVMYLKRIRQHNSGIKIIYEIPTYPYETERHLTWKNFHVALKDDVNKKKLKKFVNRIVTFYDQNEIYGIPTIKLINGFDFTTMDLPENRNIQMDEIHIIEVATTAFWHGYDRVLEGLSQYYDCDNENNKVNIVFHMVGNILPEHQEYVEKHHLEKHVIFHGRQSGELLNEIYDKCSLAIDVLGGHRKNYPVSSSLKSREYAAKGLPIITSSPVDYIEEGYPYQLIVPYDDSSLSMESIISFYRSCYIDKSIQEVMQYIRSYAQERCDMSITMKPVVDYIRGE